MLKLGSLILIINPEVLLTVVRKMIGIIAPTRRRTFITRRSHLVVFHFTDPLERFMDLFDDLSWDLKLVTHICTFMEKKSELRSSRRPSRAPRLLSLASKTLLDDYQRTFNQISVIWVFQWRNFDGSIQSIGLEDLQWTKDGWYTEIPWLKMSPRSWKF